MLLYHSKTEISNRIFGYFRLRRRISFSINIYGEAMEKGKIIKGAFILTAANIITRLLGFFYRVYMAELIGAEGMGLYQLIVPVYMLIWSISSSGFSTAISKLTASEKAAGRDPTLILRLCLALSVSIGLILGAAVYINADFIAESILNDKRTALSLHILSFCFPFMAMGSCIRGYFFGVQNSFPPAVSQVAEQVTRMAVIFIVGGFLIPKGIDYACAAAVMGMCVGETVSCVYIFLGYMSEGRKKYCGRKRSVLSAYSAILSMVIPLTLNRLASSLLSALENILIPMRLVAWGLSKTDAISEFGRLSGMALPLLMFPSSFLTAVSITIVPAISESFAMKRYSSISAAVEKSVLFATVTGFCAAGLFITLPDRISFLVYGDNQIGGLLFLLGFMSPFMYLNVMLGGILNGLGEQLAIFKNGIAGSVICLLSVWFAIPRLGIYGYISGCLLSSVATSFLNLRRVSKKTDFRLKLSPLIIKPLISMAAACAVSLNIGHTAVFSHMSEVWASAALVLVTVVLYAALLLVTGSVGKADIDYILSPFKK